MDDSKVMHKRTISQGWVCRMTSFLHNARVTTTDEYDLKESTGARSRFCSSRYINSDEENRGYTQRSELGKMKAILVSTYFVLYFTFQTPLIYFLLSMISRYFQYFRNFVNRFTRLNSVLNSYLLISVTL